MRLIDNSLKPCPFCGGMVHKIIGPYKNTVMFFCPDCGAEVSFYTSEHEPRATKAWNRRKEISNETERT